MQEITIPDGHKATIIGVTIRIEPIEPKFKRGDIIATSSGCIIIFDKWKDEISKHKNCIAGISEYGDINYNTEFGNESEWYHATPEEQQILFNALAKKGKYWDAEALEVKDFIKVPESIGIYRHISAPNSFSDLFIAYNDNNQFLGCNIDLGVYSVGTQYEKYEKVQCKLVSCKREDLKIGDTALCIVPDCTESLKKELADLLNYCKVLNNTDIACISIDKNVIIEQWDYKLNNWYKLTPINE